MNAVLKKQEPIDGARLFACEPMGYRTLSVVACRAMRADAFTACRDDCPVALAVEARRAETLTVAQVVRGRYPQAVKLAEKKSPSVAVQVKQHRATLAKARTEAAKAAAERALAARPEISKPPIRRRVTITAACESWLAGHPWGTAAEAAAMVGCSVEDALRGLGRVMKAGKAKRVRDRALTHGKHLWLWALAGAAPPELPKPLADVPVKAVAVGLLDVLIVAHLERVGVEQTATEIREALQRSKDTIGGTLRNMVARGKLRCDWSHWHKRGAYSVVAEPTITAEVQSDG